MVPVGHGTVVTLVLAAAATFDADGTLRRTGLTFFVRKGPFTAFLSPAPWRDL